MRKPPDPPEGLTAVDPREWTRAWLRVIADPSVKSVGMACQAWADYRTGANIRPGCELLMKATGIKGDKTIRNALAQVREWGLMWRYHEGRSGIKGDFDIYRLTFPDDISAIPMWSPDWEPPCG